MQPFFLNNEGIRMLLSFFLGKVQLNPEMFALFFFRLLLFSCSQG